jgi:hypothetical protein
MHERTKSPKSYANIDARIWYCSDDISDSIDVVEQVGFVIKPSSRQS